jgi:hypothetical protein
MAATITGEAGLQTTSSITCNLMALLASPNVAVRLFSFDLITMSSVNDVLADEYFGDQYVLM